MIELDEIDKRINELLGYMSAIQNADGSFDTMYLQPYYNPDKGWMKYAGNAVYETASPLVALSFLNSEKAQEITRKGICFLLKESLDSLLWTYAYPSKKALVPYDTDSTSLSSFVLSRNGYEIKNKKFLNALINDSNHYPFYIWVNACDKYLPVVTSIKMLWRNWNTRNSLNIVNNGMRLTDWEFSSSCVNLLYLGGSDASQKVWTAIQRMFETQTINYLYYLDLFHSFYFYTRLAGYRNRYDLLSNKNILDKYIAELYSLLTNKDSFQNRLLFTNALLFCNYKLEENHALFLHCFSDIADNNYQQILTMYSSNVKTDYQPYNFEPQTFFGSVAHSCALYIEFLNLYRKRFYGTYYGQD